MSKYLRILEITRVCQQDGKDEKDRIRVQISHHSPVFFDTFEEAWDYARKYLV